MRETEFTRKIDGLGRLVIPSDMRNELNLLPGVLCKFYLHEYEGELYLCIKCPGADPKVQEAKEFLRNAGYKV